MFRKPLHLCQCRGQNYTSFTFYCYGVADCSLRNASDSWVDVMIHISSAAALYAHTWYLGKKKEKEKNVFLFFFIHLVVIALLWVGGAPCCKRITELNTQWGVSIGSYPFEIPSFRHCSAALWPQEAGGHRWFCRKACSDFLCFPMHMFSV